MSSLEVKELPRLTDTHIGKAKIEKLSSDLNVKYALLESAISAVLHISFSFRFFFQSFSTISFSTLSHQASFGIFITDDVI